MVTVRLIGSLMAWRPCLHDLLASSTKRPFKVLAIMPNAQLTVHPAHRPDYHERARHCHEVARPKPKRIGAAGYDQRG